MNRMNDDEKRALGKKIKAVRKQKGLLQEQLAELVGYKVGTIAKYEQGDRVPDISMLKKIAEVLDCDLAEIAGTTNEIIKETIRFDNAVENYINWLRGVHVMLTTPIYDDDDKKEKTAIIVDIDGIAVDVGDSIDEIMQMSREHFMLLAKQFGKKVFDI